MDPVQKSDQYSTMTRRFKDQPGQHRWLLVYGSPRGREVPRHPDGAAAGVYATAGWTD